MRNILIYFANFFSILKIICIGIIKLIINLIYNITIAASVQDCFKTESFRCAVCRTGKFKYKITQKYY